MVPYEKKVLKFNDRILKTWFLLHRQDPEEQKYIFSGAILDIIYGTHFECVCLVKCIRGRNGGLGEWGL